MPFIARSLGGLLAFLQQQYRQTQRHFNRGQPQPKEDNEPIKAYAHGYQAQYMPLQGGEERGLGDYPQYEQPQAL